MNPKIGRYTPEGAVYPSEMITGKPYSRSETDPAPTIVHDFAEGYFAIGDLFPPREFDVNAALAALRAEITPAPVVSSKRATSTIEEA